MGSIVVKIGGTAGLDLAGITADVQRLAAGGDRVVVVHGGSAEIDRLGARLGVPARHLVSPDGVRTRYTCPAAIEVVTLALAGAVKTALVARLVTAGVPAVGLTGLDRGLLRARRTGPLRAVVDGRTRIVRDNHGGRLTRVDPAPLHTLLDAGSVPVLSPPALGEDGTALNVDADRVASAVAVALGAAALVLLTATDGVLRDPADGASAVPECRVRGGRPPAYARDGMARKLAAAGAAAAAGVPMVVVGAGRGDAPITAALAGAGTRVLSEEAR